MFSRMPNLMELYGTYVLWIGRHEKNRYSRWNFSNMLFPTEGYTIFCLGRHLGFSYLGP